MSILDLFKVSKVFGSVFKFGFLSEENKYNRFYYNSI
jgi:hypothetical protein